MTSASLRWVLIFGLVSLVSLEPHQRSGLRIVHKLVGGHINANRDDDIELMTSGAGEGQSKGKKGSQADEKKTLSQQVADGKYALIQNEIFSKPVKRPGIISYKENSEVPRDNVNNLGGLNKSDIWLSENHLLVIKGGYYPDHDEDNKDVLWNPIDDFNAPDRQVKIPAHPKVPPPFPVQLQEGGPILLFLGPNVTKTLNGTLKEGVYPVYPESNEVTGDDGSKERPPSGKHPPYPFAGETPFPIPPFPPPAGPGGRHPDEKKEGFGPMRNASFPQLFPPFFPPGMPLENVTYDEDDPSIYYPPPYSFFYPKDNSSEVPPGPLVPGIVLPPPPDFFGSLEEDDKSKSTSTSTTTPKPKVTVTTTIKQKVTKTRIYFYPTRNETTRPTVAVRKKPTITILKPISKTTSTTKQPKVVVTTTKVPLKAYYATTHLEPVPVVTEKPKVQKVVPKVVNVEVIPRRQKFTTTTSSPIRYYFYDDNVINTTPPSPPVKIKEDNYYIPKEILVPKQPIGNIQYYYVGEPEYPQEQQKNIRKPAPQQENSFSIHIARLKQEIENFQHVRAENVNNDNRQSGYFERPKPVYQYEFQAAGYRPQNYENRYLPVKRPLPHFSVEIQEAVEVTPPTPVYESTQEGYYLDGVTENPVKVHRGNHRTAKPISQYSFEATQNPLFNQFYTKHDEKFIDDATKEYFTVFGKRLPHSTTPLPIQRQKYYQRPPQPQEVPPNHPTLEGDTYVNYLPQRPPANLHSEYLLHPVREEEATYQRPPRVRRPTERPVVTYKLPGDEGTHFYFLTPQLAQKREQNASFYFSNAPKTGRRR